MSSFVKIPNYTNIMPMEWFHSYVVEIEFSIGKLLSHHVPSFSPKLRVQNVFLFPRKIPWLQSWKMWQMQSQPMEHWDDCVCVYMCDYQETRNYGINTTKCMTYSTADCCSTGRMP